MKKKKFTRVLATLLATMLALSSFAIPAHAASENYNFHGAGNYIVTKDSVPLRSKASNDGGILCYLGKNQVVTVVDTFWTMKLSKWHKIEFYKDEKLATGYIYSGNVAKLHYEKYRGSASSIVDILKALKVDSSWNHRKQIARANGFSGDSYIGSASQNQKLAQLAVAGLLVRSEYTNPIYDPDPSAVNTENDSTSPSLSTTSNTVTTIAQDANACVTDGLYFPACSQEHTSIVDALKSINEHEASTFSGRAKLAVANGIVSSEDAFTGSSQMNLALLELLKRGRLKRYMVSSFDTPTDNSASTDGSTPVSVPTMYKPFSIIEIYGSEGRTYTTTNDNVPLYSSPVDNGMILDLLPKGFPVEVDGLFQADNALWIKVKTLTQATEAWIQLEDVQLHTCQYVALFEYDVEFCSECGHLRMLHPGANLVDMDALHITLAAASLIPIIGNGFDLLDGLLSLAEGHYGAAALSFASAIPVFGSIGNALKVADNTIEIFDTTGDLVNGLKATDAVLSSLDTYQDVIVATKVGSNTVEVTVKSNSQILARNLEARWLVTHDERFYNYAEYILPGRSVAAHHIVAGNSSNSYARIARGLLDYLGIGINTAENGVFLVSRADIILEGHLHTTLHTNEYYQYVTQSLLDAFTSAEYAPYASPDMIKMAQRSAVVDALDNIARELMYGDPNISWEYKQAH